MTEPNRYIDPDAFFQFAGDESIASIARRAPVGRTNLQRLLRGNAFATPLTQRRLAAALGCKVADITKPTELEITRSNAAELKSAIKEVLKRLIS